MDPSSDLADLFLGIAGIYMDSEMYQLKQAPEYVPAPSAQPPSTQSHHLNVWAAGMGDGREPPVREGCAALGGQHWS